MRSNINRNFKPHEAALAIIQCARQLSKIDDQTIKITQLLNLGNIDTCKLEIFQVLKLLSDRVLQDMGTSTSFIQSLIVELEPKWS